MEKNIDFFYHKIMETMPTGKEHGYSEYGSKVFPAIEIYADLTEFSDKKSYQEALEKMLSSKNDRERSFAVDICLGFFVFRNVIKK
jgi:hypothetical protein